MEYRVAFRSSTGTVRFFYDLASGDERDQADRMREAGMDCWLEQRPLAQWERVQAACACRGMDERPGCDHGGAA